MMAKGKGNKMTRRYPKNGDRGTQGMIAGPIVIAMVVKLENLCDQCMFVDKPVEIGGGLNTNFLQDSYILVVTCWRR